MQANEISSSERKRSLRASIADGIGASVAVGVGESYLGIFAIFLGAQFFELAMITTLPPLFGAFSQICAVSFLGYYSKRKKIITVGAIINALVWLPIAMIAFLSGKYSIFLLGACVILYQLTNGFITPIWNSLLGDIVPAEKRGRFFARRNRYLGLSNFIALIVAGQILGVFESANDKTTGFFLIFIIASVARMISAYWLSHHCDPVYETSAKNNESFFQFIKLHSKTNFFKFSLFAAFINLGAAFAGPYFAAYMLNHLNFSYFEYTTVIGTMMLGQYLTLRYWGEISDKFGNKKILNLTGYGVAISPLFWLFSSDIRWIIIVQLYSGFVWAGYNLAISNFILDSVERLSLARYSAYFALINSASSFAGSLLGALCCWLLQQREISPYLVIFFISGVIRMMAAIFSLPKFKEIKLSTTSEILA
jgi:MFS family permease